MLASASTSRARLHLLARLHLPSSPPSPNLVSAASASTSQLAFVSQAHLHLFRLPSSPPPPSSPLPPRPPPPELASISQARLHLHLPSSRVPPEACWRLLPTCFRRKAGRRRKAEEEEVEGWSKAPGSGGACSFGFHLWRKGST